MQVRFSTRTMLALFTLAAVSCAALLFAGPIWAASFFTAAFLMICGATVAAVLNRGQERAFWIGFVLLGGGYLYMAMHDAPREPHSGRWDPWLVTSHLLIRANGYVATLRATDTVGKLAGEHYVIVGFPRRTYHLPPNTVSFVRIGHALFALSLAFLGGIWGRRCYLRLDAPVSRDNLQR